MKAKLIPSPADLASRLQTIPELANRPELCALIADDVARLRESHRFMRWLSSRGAADAEWRTLVESVKADAEATAKRIVDFEVRHAELRLYLGLGELRDLLWRTSIAAGDALLTEPHPQRPSRRPTNYEPHVLADRIGRLLTEAGITIDPTRKGTYSLVLCEALDGGTYTDDGSANRRLRETYAPLYAPRKRSKKRPAKRRALTVTKAATRRKPER